MGLLDKDLNFVKESNAELKGNSYMSGWCLASSKKIWNKLEISRNKYRNSLNNYDFNVPHYVPQIFSEEYFCYFEDTDLSFRARKLGIPMVVVNVSAVHFGKVSSKQINTHALYTRGRRNFYKKMEK